MSKRGRRRQPPPPSLSLVELPSNVRQVCRVKMAERYVALLLHFMNETERASECVSEREGERESGLLLLPIRPHPTHTHTPLLSSQNITMHLQNNKNVYCHLCSYKYVNALKYKYRKKTNKKTNKQET